MLCFAGIDVDSPTLPPPNMQCRNETNILPSAHPLSSPDHRVLSLPSTFDSEPEHIPRHRKSANARKNGHETKAQAETRKQTRTPYPPLMLLDMPTLHPDFVPLSAAAPAPPRLRHLLALGIPPIVPAFLPALGLVPVPTPATLPADLVVRRVLC